MKNMTLVCVVLLFALTTVVPAAETLTLDLGGNVTMELVRVKAGAFSMGSPATETGRNADEEQKTASLIEDYFVGKYPVTRGQFLRFVAETGYKTESEVGDSGGFGFDGVKLVQRKDFTFRNPGFAQTDNHPVVLVTYKDAQAFANWLSRKSKRAISLPTEAQWEHACRAGTSTRFYSGDGDGAADAIAWHKDNSGNGTRAVGQKQPNAWDIYDMSGNVYEWCSDVYGPYKPGGAVQGVMDKTRNVLRGGSWLKDRAGVRSAARYRNTPGSRNADNGFRVVAAVGPIVQAEVTGAAATPTSMTSQSPGTAQAPTPASAPTPMQSVATPPPPQPTPYQPVSPPVQESRRSRSGPLGTIVLIGFVVAVIFLIKKAMSRSAAGTATLPSRTDEEPKSVNLSEVRLAEDGFWLDTSEWREGDVIRVTFDGPQGTATREIIVEHSPQGQFVYTGTRPSNVRIALLAAAAATMRDRVRPSDDIPDSQRDSWADRHRDEDRHAHRGFPSAY